MKFIREAMNVNMSIIRELVKGLHQRGFDESFVIAALCAFAETECELAESGCVDWGTAEQLDDLLDFVNLLSWEIRRFE